MTDRTEARMCEVRRRIREKKRLRERRGLSTAFVLGAASATGIGNLLHKLQPRGVVEVEQGYCSVLLHRNTEAYVLVGVAAFAVGATVTLLSVRYAKKVNRTKSAEEREEVI